MPERHAAPPLAPDRIEAQSRLLIRELATLRESKGLTQAEVARQMGTTQPYIARFEKASSDPRLSTLIKYALIVAGGAIVAAILTELEKQTSGSVVGRRAS